MRIRILGGMVLAALCGAAFTNAPEASDFGARTKFHVTDRVLFSHSLGETSDVLAANTLVHENRLRAESGIYSTALQFSNQLTPDSHRTAVNRPFVFEKGILETEGEVWKLTLGDSHQEFGRGIALSLYRDTVFGIDNTLQGAALKYQPSGLESVVFAGRVNALNSPVALNPLEHPLKDRDLYLGGLSLTGKLAAKSKLGAHYLLALEKQFKRPDISKRWNTVGMTFNQEEIFSGVDAYLETNVLLTESLLTPGVRNPPAFGSFVALTYAGTPWKIKLEGKDYRDYRFEFRRAPTLEEDIVESINNENVSAVRLGVEHRESPKSASLFASYLLGDDRIYQSVVHHGVVGIKGKWFSNSEWEARLGYRSLPAYGDMAHGNVKAKFPTAKAQAIELGLRKQYQRIGFGEDVSLDDRNKAELAYSFSDTFNIGLGYEYLPTNDVSVGRHFANIAANYKSGNLTARSLLGGTGGGTQCSGGVCRVVPPFNGAYIETAYQF